MITYISPKTSQSLPHAGLDTENVTDTFHGARDGELVFLHGQNLDELTVSGGMMANCG